MKGFFSPLLEEAWMQHAMEYLAHREPFLLSGAGDSVQNHLAAAFSVLQERPILVIAPSELRAKEIQEELSFYDPKGTVFFPAKDQLFYGADSKGQAIEASRIRTLRELSEETGFTADELIYLGGCCTSPGFSTEVLHLYLALGLHPGKSHPDEDEFLNVETYPLSELSRMVMDGEIDDAKTIVAVLKAEKYLAEHKI